MPEPIDDSGFEGLIKLFNIADKSTVKKSCRNLIVTQKDLFHLILVGQAGKLESYQYASHFVEIVPPHLQPTDEDLEVIASNGVGLMSLDAQKTFRKIDQLFKDRRVFAAHLFFTPLHDYWHLIYFDQRDTESKGNHWKVGSTHIHYSRESFCQISMSEMWQDICDNPPKPPSSLHIRYKDEKD